MNKRLERISKELSEYNNHEMIWKLLTLYLKDISYEDYVILTKDIIK